MSDNYPNHSRTQLVDQALRVLGVTPIGQPHAEDDILAVDVLVEPLLARLNAMRITYHVDAEGNVTQLDDPQAIPAKAFFSVATLLAAAAMQKFGLAALPVNDPTQAEIDLRTVWSVGPTQEEYEELVTDLDTDESTLVTKRRNETVSGEWF